jgi:hypothetical protein
MIAQWRNKFWAIGSGGNGTYFYKSVYGVRDELSNDICNGSHVFQLFLENVSVVTEGQFPIERTNKVLNKKSVSIKKWKPISYINITDFNFIALFMAMLNSKSICMPEVGPCTRMFITELNPSIISRDCHHIVFIFLNNTNKSRPQAHIECRRLCILDVVRIAVSMQILIVLAFSVIWGLRSTEMEWFPAVYWSFRVSWKSVNICDRSRIMVSLSGSLVATTLLMGESVFRHGEQLECIDKA